MQPQILMIIRLAQEGTRIDLHRVTANAPA